MSSEIYCCGCGQKVKAVLTSGAEIYPHRRDLHRLPFWKCPTCSNYVGCHHKTANRTKPLGNIPTPELRNARKHIHAVLDPLWEGGAISRSEAYAWITMKVGWRYHTANIKSVDEARTIYRHVIDLKNELTNNKGEVNARTNSDTAHHGA